MAESSPTPNLTSSPASASFSTSFTPTGTRDSAPGTHNDDDDDNDMGVPGSITSYYFVFLMLSLCVIGLVLFLNFRRRRKRRLQMLYGRPDAFHPDPAASRGRRYWQGRWGSANVSREEGLNEHGEAPPPYVPKRSSQEVHREGGEGGQSGPAVPLQTLSRDHAGLKPPDYEEVRGDGEDITRPSWRPVAGGSSSQQTGR